MKVFVTGASGFLGRYFLEQLLATLGSDDTVYVLTRRGFEPSDKRLVPQMGDLRTIEKCSDSLLESAYVFHIGGEARFGNQFAYQEDNVVPTQKMVAILKQSRLLRNFVFTSTIGAFDRAPNDDLSAAIRPDSTPSPTSKYGQSKLACEAAIRNAGIPFTILRPTWIFGKGMRLNSHINAFVSMVKQKPWMARFNFPGRVSVIHVSDMAKALCRCINNESVIGKSYFCVTESIGLGSILALIAQQMHGSSRKQINVPRFAMVFSRLHSKLPLALNNLFMDYLCAKDDHFVRDFSVSSAVTLKEGLSEVINSNPLVRGSYLITGANSGIGLSLANILQERGEHLILVDVACDKLKKQFPKQVLLEGDLRDPNFLNSVVERSSAYPLRCLMNVAGVGFKGTFTELSTDQIESTVKVNILAPMKLIHFLRFQLKADQTDIVNIASSVAYYPLPGMGLYAASKSFLASWSEALAVELKETNRVFTVSPGGTNTNFQTQAGVKPTNDLLSPDKVATAIVSKLGGKGGTYLVGARAKVLALLGRLLSQRRMAILMGQLFLKAR